MNFNIIVISHFNKQIVLDKLILEHQNLSYLDLKRLIYDENLYSRINFSKLNSSDFNILEIYPTSKILINSASKFLNLKPEKTIMKTTLQILSKLKPEIIILRDFDAFSIDEINNLKFNGTIKSKTVLLNGYPLRNTNNYSKFDHVVFRLPYLLENFKNICKNSNLIYHCFNKNILKKLFNKKFENKSRELTFLGSSYSHGFYQHRKRYYYL